MLCTFLLHTLQVDTLPGGRQQPFYRVLVDVRDRPFQRTYVGQCNIELLTLDQAASPSIVQPDIGQYFEGQAPGSMRFTPNAYLNHRFPCDAP